MKRLVISDIHLGLSTSKYREFIDLFYNTIQEYSEVILLGDIIQGVFHKFTDEEMKFFDFLSKAKRVVYVLGNHDNDSSDGKEYSDEEIKKYIRSLFKNNVHVCNEYEYTNGISKYMFVHGHTFMSDDTSFGIKVAKAFYKFQKLFGNKYNAVFNVFDKVERLTSSAIEKVRRGAINYAFSKMDGQTVIHYVFCGHSHQVDYSGDGYIFYFNTGQWLRNETNFIEIDEDEIKVYNYNIKTRQPIIHKFWSK